MEKLWSEMLKKRWMGENEEKRLKKAHV